MLVAYLGILHTHVRKIETGSPKTIKGKNVKIVIKKSKGVRGNY